jgi:hypothetical protein
MEWSREELSASVIAYIEMRDLELQGKKFTKKRVYETQRTICQVSKSV